MVSVSFKSGLNPLNCLVRLIRFSGPFSLTKNDELPPLFILFPGLFEILAFLELSSALTAYTPPKQGSIFTLDKHELSPLLRFGSTPTDYVGSPSIAKSKHELTSNTELTTIHNFSSSPWSNSLRWCFLSIYNGLLPCIHSILAGRRLGSGCYFSTVSELACQNKYSPPNKDGERFMILARVVTGEFCLGDKSFKSSPISRDENMCEIKYDSVVDDMKNPRIFCVFDDAAAYTDYVIKYKL